MSKADFKALEDLGRVQLSKSFFMREFLYSEIAQIENISNMPENPDWAIEVGKKLCENILEPIQDALGRISIRSGYRSRAVNEAGNKQGSNCADNDKNFGRHIWDALDKDGYKGATACIVVTSFVPYYQKTGDWTALAWWIHDHLRDVYADMEFFTNLAAFNITWSANREYPQYIYSRVENPHTGKHSGYLTKKGMDNFEGSHEEFYKEFIQQLRDGATE